MAPVGQCLWARAIDGSERRRHPACGLPRGLPFVVAHHPEIVSLRLGQPCLPVGAGPAPNRSLTGGPPVRLEIRTGRITFSARARARTTLTAGRHGPAPREGQSCLRGKPLTAGLAASCSFCVPETRGPFARFGKPHLSLNFERQDSFTARSAPSLDLTPELSYALSRRPCGRAAVVGDRGGPGSADHSSGELGVPGLSERQLRAFERSVLGPAHAAEHARVRRAERTGESPPARRLSRSSVRAAAAACWTPEQVGRWGAPFSIPVMGIHAAMLPTGKVMWFSYPKNPTTRHGGGGVNDPNTAQAWLWDPATGTTKRVDPPLWRDPRDGVLKPANIWCGGQTVHRRWAAGCVRRQPALLGPRGAGRPADFMGLNKVYTFNPWNETWTEQPDTRHGRWYPTGVRMPDGRIVVVGGLDESGAGFKRNTDVELFTPSADLNGRGTVSLLGTLGGAGHPPVGGLYPHMFSMPSGRTLVAGPFPEDTWFLNPPGASNSLHLA